MQELAVLARVGLWVPALSKTSLYNTKYLRHAIFHQILMRLHKILTSVCSMFEAFTAILQVQALVLVTLRIVDKF
jgi:hypothetical protein